MKNLVVKKSKIEGYGLFAAEEIHAGEFVQFIKGDLVKKESRSLEDTYKMQTWYGITNKLWLNPQKTIFRFLNHSCNPNLAIVGTKKLIARKNIKKDEEVCIDYSMTDGDLNWKMNCLCESHNCRKVIYPIQKLNAKVVKGHLPHLTRYFLKLYRQYNPDVKI